MATIFDTLNYNQKVNYVFQCLTFVVCVIGIVGSVLLVVVFMRQSLRKYSYSFYSHMKAYADILILLFGIRNWVRYVFGLNLDTVNWLFCALFNKYLIYIGTIMSIWLMAVITLDRLVTIKYPHRFEFSKKRWFQATLVLVIFVYSVVVNIILPMNTNMKPAMSPADNQTTAVVVRWSCQATSDVLAKHSWIISAHIFFVILILNNIMIALLIKHILSSRMKVAQSKQSPSSRISYRDRKFAITTIVISLMAVVFKLPKMLVNIVLESSGITNDIYLMWFSIGITIFDIETGCSFYLNLLLNPTFYNEFVTMFRSNATKRDQSSLSFAVVKSRTREQKA